MCEHLKGVADLTAAAQALTLACMRRAGAPVGPYNTAYDHVACEPLPTELTALLDQLGPDLGTA